MDDNYPYRILSLAGTSHYEREKSDNTDMLCSSFPFSPQRLCKLECMPDDKFVVQPKCSQPQHKRNSLILWPYPFQKDTQHSQASCHHDNAD